MVTQRNKECQYVVTRDIPLDINKKFTMRVAKHYSRFPRMAGKQISADCALTSELSLLSAHV